LLCASKLPTDPLVLVVVDVVWCLPVFYLLVYPKVAPMMDLEVPLLLVSLRVLLRSAFNWDCVILCRLDGLAV